jgi:thioredoxin-related protein
MKNTGAQIVLSVLLLITTSFIQAQSGKLPPFKMIQTTGNIFKAQNLPMGKPILIVYFSPECDHCEKMLKDFFKQASNFQNASIAFITYLPVDKVSKFEKDYNLAKHPNMYSGTEGSTFFVRNYYKISETPFVALYTKNGDFVTSYEREVDLKVLSEKLTGLK